MILVTLAQSNLTSSVIAPGISSISLALCADIALIAIQEITSRAFVPAPRLVCVETNPGPKTKAVITIKRSKKKKSHGLPKISGRGDYSITESVGRSLGGMAGNVIGKIFGSGAYSIRGNSLHSNTVPAFAVTKNGNEFAHREFVRDIFSGPTLSNGATTFNLNQYVINPADVVLFPWVQQIAQNYEMYELLGLIFEYVPSSGNAVSSTNAALGTVIFATQYNSLDAPFISKRQMESYEFATSTVPSMSMVHPVECADQANALTTLYVNNPGSQTALGDPRFANIGILNIATVGQQAANVNLGELWVSVHVRFKRPRLAPGAYTAHIFGHDVDVAVPYLMADVSSMTSDPLLTTIKGVTITSGTLSGNNCMTLNWPLGYRGQFSMAFTTVSITGNWAGAVSAGVIGGFTGGLTPLLFQEQYDGPVAYVATPTLPTSGTLFTSLGGLITFQSDGSAGSLSFYQLGHTAYPSKVSTDIFISLIGNGVDF
jgi:hypothetical protein